MLGTPSSNIQLPLQIANNSTFKRHFKRASFVSIPDPQHLLDVASGPFAFGVWLKTTDTGHVVVLYDKRKMRHKGGYSEDRGFVAYLWQGKVCIVDVMTA